MDIDEKKMRQIAKEEAQKLMVSNYRAGNPKIPPHTHNGTDGLKISQKNIISNNKVRGSLSADNGGGSGTISLLTNPSSFHFYGFAFSSTKKATITGQAEFGNCLQITSLTAQTPIKSSIIQVNDAFIVTPSGPTFNVSAAQDSFASIGDQTTVFATITAFTNTSVSLNVVLAAGWTLTGYFIIT